jgi:disulfide bond formation protein DsbB
MTLVSTASLILSSLTVIGQLAVAVALFAIITRNEKIIVFGGRGAVLFSFVVALIATAGSLFYSEIAGFEPCKLCWFQRIFMYPQVILFGIALWKKNETLAVYNSIALSIIGGLIAGYHYLVQIGAAPALPCSAVGYSASCAQRFVMTFGYITIPMMAFTAFMLIIVFMFAKRLYHQKDESFSSKRTTGF